MRRSLKQVSLLFVVSVIFAVFSVWKTLSPAASSLGRHLFAHAAAQPENIAAISVTGGGYNLNFDKTDNLWTLRQSDSYYVNYNFIKEFLDMIQNARIYQEIDNPETGLIPDDMPVIEVFDRRGKLLDKVQLGNKSDNRRFAYIRQNDSPKIFLAENNLNLPQAPIRWLQQPLLSLDTANIKSITKGQGIILRPQKNMPFYNAENNPVNPDVLLSGLNYLEFDDVKSVQNFDEQIYEKSTPLTITMFDGRVIALTVFTDGSQYWLKQKLSTTALPTKEADDYVKNNEFLSNFWYFKLNQNLGQMLFNTQI